AALFVDNRIVLSPGDGAGNFGSLIASPGEPLLQNGVHEMLPADMNGDGHLDLIVASRQPDWITTLLGQGDGTFVTLPPQETPYIIARLVVDLDGDGRPEIVERLNEKAIRVLRGDGTGRFEVSQTIAIDADPEQMAAADFDQDGHVDVVLSTSQGKRLILPGAPGGRLGQPFALVGHSTQGGLFTADVNGDGRPDLAQYEQSRIYLEVVLNISP
ncbi:MAG: VCBS repeat-containing protein, partial [Myxococcales bacterium]